MSTQKRNEWHRERLARLREQFGGACQDCGATVRLEFAHVKPTGLSGLGRGQNHRALDVAKHPEAYRLLCRRCHRKLDGTGPKH